MDITQNLWMLLILPLFAVLFICIPSNCVSIPKRRITLGLTLFASGLSLILTLFFGHRLLQMPGEIFESNFLFLNAGTFKIHIGVLLDNISAFMLLILYITAICTQIFSYKYMWDEERGEGFTRYFILLNMFVFSMAGLILSTNLIQFYLFWELVGLFSYLLIGFHYKKPDAAQAARKAFLVNRIGDFALFAAVIGFSCYAMSDHNTVLYPLLSLNDVNSWGFLAYAQLGAFLYAGICLLVSIGAFAKSAQIPFQVWLVDAMEAPTPISALIHCATMVTAGVYLLIRLYPALILSPAILKTIAIVGITTALVFGGVAIAQSDIKKILAFSTSSQLGLMFTALGCGAYTGCIFCLGMHGIAKALLFLIAGIIINKTLTKNIKFLGGLREYMPTLAVGWLLGALSISGVFFSGFYTKEMILTHLYDTGQYVFLGLSILTGLLSIAYLFRSYFLIFEGHYKGTYDFSSDENLPQGRFYDGINLFMFVPACVLAFFTAFLGGFMAPDFQRYIYILRQKFYLIRHPELEISMFVLFGLMIYLMWQVYGSKKFKIKRIRTIYRLFVLQFFINRAFETCYRSLIKGFSKVIKTLDKYVVEGFGILLAQSVRFGSYLVSRLQNGSINSYALYSFIFVTAVLLCAVIVYFKGISQYGG